MQKHNLIKELRAIQIRKGEIEGELRSFLKERAESLRQFHEGEIVSVMSEGDKFICNGIVGHVFIFPLNDFEIKSMAENQEKYLKHISDIRYKVYAIKKDGTRSSRNATSSQSLGIKKREFMTSSYIKKAEL